MKIIIKKVFIRKAKLQKDNFDKSFKLKFKYNL